MLRNNKSTILSAIFILIVFFGIQNDMCYSIIKVVFDNKELNTLLTTLIAGLFGFVVAIIPFAIHLLNQDNDFVDKLKKEDNLKLLINPLFNRFFDFLMKMLMLFIFLLVFAAARDIILEYFNIWRYIISIIFSVYIILVFNFLLGIYRLILDLKSLVQIFFNTHKKEK